MTVDQMRVAITEVYPGPKWKMRVARMYDDQVIAVYYEFLRTGKFNKNQKELPTKTPACTPTTMNLTLKEDGNSHISDYSHNAEQLSIFDLL